MTRERKTAVITLIILGVLVLVAMFVIYQFVSPRGFYARSTADITEIAGEGESAYTNLEGEPVDIGDFQGKPLVVNVWASWSPYSKSDFAVLGRLQSEYGDRVRFVAINRMETRATANAYLDAIGRVEGVEFIIDEQDTFFNTVEGYAMPETLFYDEVGNIAFHVRGNLTYEDAHKLLESIDL